MKIAILQLAPKLGCVEDNIASASNYIKSVQPGSVDLLVLPELAFSGYNFPSLAAIMPFLEATAAGPSTDWAIHTAVRLRCTVIVGYPEVTKDGERYNSTVMVGPDGLVIGDGYRKSFLYYTDETWALEGSGFQRGLGEMVFNDAASPGKKNSVQIAQGICMDLNPYAFKAPCDAYEFATHVVNSEVSIAVLSMAWLTAAPDLSLKEHDQDAFAVDTDPVWSKEEAKKPHLGTLSYWLERLTPLISRNRYTIVILANRCGRERAAIYAGTSCVLKLGYGKMLIHSIMARDIEGIVQCDTNEEATGELMLRSLDKAEDNPGTAHKDTQ